MIRAAVTTILFCLLATRGSAGPAEASRLVVFVCEHGSAKSVVAAAQFNALAEKRRLSFRAVARGTDPDPELAPPALRGLAGEGLKPSEQKPIQLTQSDLDRAARVVSFCEIPRELRSPAALERWEVPPIGSGYEASRDAMVARIEKLLNALQGD